MHPAGAAKPAAILCRSGGGGLLAQHSPFPFGIDCLRPNGDGDRWAEFELTIVLQDEVPYLAVFRPCTECDPAGGSCAALDPFEYADPERRLEAYRQAQKWMSITKPS